MRATLEDVKSVVVGLSLGDGHKDQERAVAAALQRLVVYGQRGVVLADEVGFGKTYEALAIASNLCALAKKKRSTFDRVLILCKSALVRKWEEETSSTRKGKGFPRYLGEMHPAQELFENVRCIDSKATAAELRRNGRVRGQRLDGRNQVRPGLYIVNERLLQEEKRRTSVLLRQIWSTKWDLVIVDEAHHYARGNKPARLFAPDGDLRNYDQHGLEFKNILALTATPFELTPTQLVGLLALIRADEPVLENIKRGLENFVRGLDMFFELRERSVNDVLRKEQVSRLQRIRDHDALGDGVANAGLQDLLRRFLIRNTKRQNERRYFLVEKGPDGFYPKEFKKLDDDLSRRVRSSSLIPFEGEHTLFYLELRELIQEVTVAASESDSKRTFIPTDLKQGLSSYRQIAGSALLSKDLSTAKRLRALVESWNENGKLHPKVEALARMVDDILNAEIDKVRGSTTAWFSKILIFNNLISGTAPQLTEVLGERVQAKFDAFLTSLLDQHGTSSRELADRVRKEVDVQLDEAERLLRTDPELGQWSMVPDEFTNDAFIRFQGKSLLRPFREPLRRRAVQTMALVDLAQTNGLDDVKIGQWVSGRITGPVIHTVRGVIDRYLDDTHEDELSDYEYFEHAERDLLVELEESKSVDVVGRFDGTTAEYRESHRRNFNRRYNPFILLVGAVGTEGIDLQEQCRYVIHYDLEWNPARMEQREGRVDRHGWGRADEGYIDVRFLLLKGTYEERIFHAVMQRDQWFQILIGSKRCQLGEVPEDVEKAVQQDEIDDEESAGILTEEEKMQVMIDLRPA
jgi:ERCC4-related helicase